MSNIAVRVETLGKMYRIGGKQERYRTLRDSLTGAFVSPYKRARSLLRGQAYGAAGLEEMIWALKDVSFEVKHGEVVGIIGRNGAGKSTLLKVLSRITEPTEGVMDLYGRIGALLEVGTGFHPELTGRENVYLNGAILGMSRQEIDRKFDEIVDFAGVEKFIDTPVKHYSSGMALRLGFAVAAHLEPEILVIDEVLAVGDAEFQKKCLGKMGEVASAGRTVLFVSHNMAAVANLCQRGFWLENGKLVSEGDMETIIREYLRSTQTNQKLDLAERTDRDGSGDIIFTQIWLEDQTGHVINSFRSGDKVTFKIRFSLRSEACFDDVLVSMTIRDLHNYRLFTLANHFYNSRFDGITSETVLSCQVSDFPVVSGKYTVDLWMASNHIRHDYISNALELTVTDGDFFESGQIAHQHKHGAFLVKHKWDKTEA